ncbi:hypothetical protein BGZ76_005890, partial [Entomortierella beljakovae]
MSTSAPTSSSKTFMHSSQLPPVPPSLSISQSQQQQQQSTRNNLFQPLAVQNQPFGLAHLSELMTGGMMVSKPSVVTQPGSSNKLAPLSIINHTTARNHPAPMVSIQSSQMQSSSPQSNQESYSGDQSTVSFYSVQQEQQQQQQQQRHAAYLMTR